MIAMTSAPRLYCGSSDASGRFTLMMRSASLSASALMVAPTAVNSESGSPDLMPAPGSITTSTPSALNFFTVSGETATRGSDGSISLATAIFMKPPAAQRPRARIWRWGSKSVEWRAARRRAEAGSGQENRHHRHDEDHGGAAVFHQLDEAFIGLLVRGIIVAVGGGVGNFVVVRHQSLQPCSSVALELA